MPSAAVISPHSFRSTFVTEALDAGVPLQDVQDAGHANPRHHPALRPQPAPSRPPPDLRAGWAVQKRCGARPSTLSRTGFYGACRGTGGAGPVDDGMGCRHRDLTCEVSLTSTFVQVRGPRKNFSRSWGEAASGRPTKERPVLWLRTRNESEATGPNTPSLVRGAGDEQW